jgi:hypothetical protein
MEMPHTGNRRRLGRRAGAVGLAVICSAATAAAASAATMSASVSPLTIHKGTSFTIKIKGTYKQSELKGTAFLIAFIQYSTAPCKSTATKELAVTSGAYAHSTVPHSPFTRKDSFTAGVAGKRRVCAYLFPKEVSPGDNTAPIAKATVTYAVTKKH